MPDHTAAASQGGWVIATKTNCVKSVTGFSRFQFALAAGEQITFDVVEEVSYTECLTTSQLPAFLKKASSVPLEEKDPQTFATIRQMVFQEEAKAALGAVANLVISESNLATWTTGSSVRPQQPLLAADMVAQAQQILQAEARTRELRREIDVCNARLQKVFVNQSRLRDNIKSLEKVAASDKLLARYMADLGREEDDILSEKRLIEGKENAIADLDKELQQLRFQITAAAQKALERL